MFKSKLADNQISKQVKMSGSTNMFEYLWLGLCVSFVVGMYSLIIYKAKKQRKTHPKKTEPTLPVLETIVIIPQPIVADIEGS
jgi:hypothetical protein